MGCDDVTTTHESHAHHQPITNPSPTHHSPSSPSLITTSHHPLTTLQPLPKSNQIKRNETNFYVVLFVFYSIYLLQINTKCKAVERREEGGGRRREEGNLEISSLSGVPRNFLFEISQQQKRIMTLFIKHNHEQTRGGEEDRYCGRVGAGGTNLGYGLHQGWL